MLFDYANVVIFTLVGVGFLFVTLLLGGFLRPQVPTLEKLETYECGELPIGSAWMNFNIRFYVIALVFVVFDVEMAMMFPILRVFRGIATTGEGVWLVIAEVFAFVAILLMGFIYAWKKGDLDWVKKITQEIKRA